MRLSRLFPLLAAAIVFVTAQGAYADVFIRVDKSAQVMTVTVDGAQRYAWPVSTGLASYDTPAGQFQPFRMERDHFSREWDDAPMPHSIFFTQDGHAIHGSSHVKNLGRPASHGCVRLAPENAAVLFALVKAQGVKNTRVALVGEIPRTNELVARRGNPTIMADEEEFTGALPQRKLRTAPGGWREIPSGARGFNDDARAFYYREQPYYAPRRYYRYGYGGLPYGW
jgi:hypothetical protein